MGPDEHAIIQRFFRPLAGEGAFELRDDAARLTPPPGSDLVVTSDMIAAGVHFLPDDPPGTIAQKALRVNLSDLAAKGAKPIAYLLSAGLSADLGEAWLEAFADGLRRDHAAFGLTLLGGDTISIPSGPVLSVTAFGTAPSGRMVHRFGGRAGDALFVSGTIGAAAAGLAILKREPGPWDRLSLADRDALVGRYRVPEPRVALAPALRDFASAAMDISDGLVGDCDKLGSASGCAASIQVERVPLPTGLVPSPSRNAEPPRSPHPEEAREGRLEGRGRIARAMEDPSRRRSAAPQDEGGRFSTGDRDIDAALLARLLTAGDDYEILAAVPPEHERGFRDAARTAGVEVTCIGALTAGSGPTEVLLDGVALPLNRRSWVHGETAAPEVER